MCTNPDPRPPTPDARRTTRATLVALAAGAVLLGACGVDDTADATGQSTTTTTTTAAEEGEPASSPTAVGPEQTGDEDPVSLGQPGEVAAGDTVETPNLGGLRFVVPEDLFIHQSPGFIAIEQSGEILLVRVVESLAGEPIDSVDAVIAFIDEATRTLDEIDPATIAGLEARVLDFTAEPNPSPRPEDAIFRTEEGGVGGWGPAAEGRVWLLDTPRGIMLLSAGALEPGAVDPADVIAEAETIFATLELVEVGRDRHHPLDSPSRALQHPHVRPRPRTRHMRAASAIGSRLMAQQHERGCPLEPSEGGLEGSQTEAMMRLMSTPFGLPFGGH